LRKLVPFSTISFVLDQLGPLPLLPILLLDLGPAGHPLPVHGPLHQLLIITSAPLLPVVVHAIEGPLPVGEVLGCLTWMLPTIVPLQHGGVDRRNLAADAAELLVAVLSRHREVPFGIV